MMCETCKTTTGLVAEMIEEVQREATFSTTSPSSWLLLISKRDALSELRQRLVNQRSNPRWARQVPTVASPISNLLALPTPDEVEAPPASRTLSLRCPLCNGTGWAAIVRDNHGGDDVDMCHGCRGSGRATSAADRPVPKTLSLSAQV